MVMWAQLSTARLCPALLFPFTLGSRGHKLLLALQELEWHGLCKISIIKEKIQSHILACEIAYLDGYPYTIALQTTAPLNNLIWRLQRLAASNLA